jgi:hypothetical protein
MYWTQARNHVFGLRACRHRRRNSTSDPHFRENVVPSTEARRWLNSCRTRRARTHARLTLGPTLERHAARTAAWRAVGPHCRHRRTTLRPTLGPTDVGNRTPGDPVLDSASNHASTGACRHRRRTSNFDPLISEKRVVPFTEGPFVGQPPDPDVLRPRTPRSDPLPGDTLPTVLLMSCSAHPQT